jgi:DNA-binding MarR family transcriptional regulator
VIYLSLHNENSLLFLLFKIQKLLFTKSNELFEKVNLHPGQPPLLFILHNHEGITQKELAEKLNVTPPTVAVMIRRMEKYELIEKKHDKNDRRIYRVYLSKKGREMIKELHKIFKELEIVVFENFDNEEKETLRNFLNKVVSNIEMSLERRK